MRAAGAAIALLVIGLPASAFSQTDTSAGQSKRSDSSQDGLFDYETTQSQDKQLLDQRELKRGDPAPDIKLTPFTESNSGSAVQLSSLYKERPLVMLMGSCTCGLTKKNAPKLEELYQEYGEKAHFAFVYIKDAHPSPEKSVEVDGKKVRLAQPETLSQRIDLTKHLIDNTGFTMPIYIDDMKGTGRKAFAGFHLAAYVINTNGKLVLVKPYKYGVEDVKTALLPLLNIN